MFPTVISLSSLYQEVSRINSNSRPEFLLELANNLRPKRAQVSNLAILYSLFNMNNSVLLYNRINKFEDVYKTANKISSTLYHFYV